MFISVKINWFNRRIRFGKNRSIENHCSLSYINHQSEVIKTLITLLYSLFRIKDVLLQSDIILESFGNSRTIRNDNSSRFGKYLSIHFDEQFDLISGDIQYYFPDKSRVVTQQLGERNFHAIYQLLSSEDRVETYGLNYSPDNYFYVNQGNCWFINGIDDSENYQRVLQALKIVGFEKEEISTIWKILSAIIHLVRMKFVCIINDNVEIFLGKFEIYGCQWWILYYNRIDRSFRLGSLSSRMWFNGTCIDINIASCSHSRWYLSNQRFDFTRFSWTWYIS